MKGGILPGQRPPREARVVVRSLSPRATKGWLVYGNLRFPCALGRAGRRVRKREGDGATPAGAWPVRQAFYRADRMTRPRAGIALRPLRQNDGWCETPGDRNYNRLVRRPYPSSAEAMWREDGLYDLVVVLGHNDRPRIPGAGSAIFMHLARDGFLPTAGCVALRRGDLARLLAAMGQGTRVRII